MAGDDDERRVLKGSRLALVLMQGIEYHGRRSASGSRPASGRQRTRCERMSARVVCSAARSAMQCHRSDQGTSDSMGLHLPLFKKRSASPLPT